MPEYRFRFIGPDCQSEPTEPVEFAGIAEARAEVLRGGREIIAEAVTQEEQMTVGAIEILDLAGNCLATVQLADLVPSVPRIVNVPDCR
jgi:hypothetical protein